MAFPLYVREFVATLIDVDHILFLAFVPVLSHTALPLEYDIILHISLEVYTPYPLLFMA